MTDTPTPAATPIEVAESAVQQQVKGQVRLGLAALAGALVGKHILPAGLVNDTVLDAVSAVAMMGFASVWQDVRVRLQHSRLWQLAINPRVPDDLVRPLPGATLPPIPDDHRITPAHADVGGAEPDGAPSMSIASELTHLLGIVRGLLIKGQSPQVVNITHAVEQAVADAFGPAAITMAKSLASTSPATMTGRDKLFAIGDAIVTTAKQGGFKGDLATLKTAALKVALTAYEAAEPNFGADIQTLAMHLSANPFVGVVAELAGSAVQAAADKSINRAAASMPESVAA